MDKAKPVEKKVRLEDDGLRDGELIMEYIKRYRFEGNKFLKKINI